MRIIHLRIHQVLIVRFDQIPIGKLFHKKAVNELSAIFQLSNIQIEDEKNLLGINGLIQTSSGEFVINRLSIEDRRILLDMEGDSILADQVISKLKSFLALLANTEDYNFLEPIVKAQESEIIAELNFGVNKLMPEQVVNFIQKDITQALTSDNIQPRINPHLFTFVVNFQTPENFQDDYRVTLSRKELVLGPRPGFPISDQVYYSKAPTDSDTHKNILLKLEELLQ